MQYWRQYLLFYHFKLICPKICNNLTSPPPLFKSGGLYWIVLLLLSVYRPLVQLSFQIFVTLHEDVCAPDIFRCCPEQGPVDTGIPMDMSFAICLKTTDLSLGVLLHFSTNKLNYKQTCMRVCSWYEVVHLWLYDHRVGHKVVTSTVLGWVVGKSAGFCLSRFCIRSTA